MGTISSVLGMDVSEVDAAKNAMIGLSKESIIAASAQMGLSESQVRCMLVLAGLEDEELEVAVATAMAGKSATAASKGFAQFFTALKTFFKTNPVGWAILIVGSIAAVAGVVDALTTSYDEAADASKEAREAYESTNSEIDSLNSKLETTKSRIDELKTKGTLTLTEKSELDTLEAQNAQLERELEIKKRLAQHQGEQAAQAAATTLSTKYTVQTGNVYADSSGSLIYETKSVDILEDTKSMQDELNQKKEEQIRLTERLSKLDPGSSAYESTRLQLDTINDEINELGTNLSTNLNTISTEYSSLIDANGNVYKGYETIAQKAQEALDYCLSASDKAQETQDVIDSVLSRPTLKGFVDQLVNMAKAGEEISFDKIEEEFPQLASAIEEACKDGEAATGDFISSILAMANIPNIGEMTGQLRDAFLGSQLKDGPIGMSALTNITDQWDSWIDSLSDTDIEILYGIVHNNDTSAWSFADFQQALADAKKDADSGIKINIEADRTSFTNLYAAMKESVSATGMTEEAISNVRDRYQEFFDAGYDQNKLFEKTANGIHLNTKALRELEAEYAKFQFYVAIQACLPYPVK